MLQTDDQAPGLRIARAFANGEGTPPVALDCAGVCGHRRRPPFDRAGPGDSSRLQSAGRAQPAIHPLRRLARRRAGQRRQRLSDASKRRRNLPCHAAGDCQGGASHQLREFHLFRRRSRAAVHVGADCSRPSRRHGSHRPRLDWLDGSAEGDSEGAHRRRHSGGLVQSAGILVNRGGQLPHAPQGARRGRHRRLHRRRRRRRSLAWERPE